VRDLRHADVAIGEHRFDSLDVVVREFRRTASCAAMRARRRGPLGCALGSSFRSYWTGITDPLTLRLLAMHINLHDLGSSWLDLPARVLDPLVRDSLNYEQRRGGLVLSGEVTVGGPGTCAFMPRGLPHAWKSTGAGNRAGAVSLYSGQGGRVVGGAAADAPQIRVDERARVRRFASATAGRSSDRRRSEFVWVGSGRGARKIATIACYWCAGDITGRFLQSMNSRREWPSWPDLIRPFTRSPPTGSARQKAWITGSIPVMTTFNRDNPQCHNPFRQTGQRGSGPVTRIWSGGHLLPATGTVIGQLVA